MSLTCNTRPSESTTSLASYTGNNTRPGEYLLATASSSEQINVLKTGPEIEPEKLLVHGSTGSTVIEPEN
jgi:hypothetical protein